MPALSLEDFKASLDDETPPPDLSPPLAALWWSRRDWGHAHKIVQDDPGGEAAWIHAYLHRVDGDPSNAGYWYKRAGKATPDGSLEDEWEAIATALLAP